jgi:thiamine pyrophosphokinase
VIVAGAPVLQPQPLAAVIPPGAVVIAADGGLRLCRALRLSPSVLVGDMDTLTTLEVSEAESEGTEIRRYPSDKEQSDLELAILAAHQMGARRVTVLGALGGQWDHCLANLLAPLSLCHSLGMWGRLVCAGAQIYLLTPGIYVLETAAGTRASLAALSEVATGVTLRGFHYDLEAADIGRHQTLGLANAVKTTPAHLHLTGGELLLTLIDQP